MNEKACPQFLVADSRTADRCLPGGERLSTIIDWSAMVGKRLLLGLSN